MVGSPGRMAKLSRSVALGRFRGFLGNSLCPIPRKFEGGCEPVAPGKGEASQEGSAWTHAYSPWTDLDGKEDSIIAIRWWRLSGFNLFQGRVRAVHAANAVVGRTKCRPRSQLQGNDAGLLQDVRQ